MVGGGKGLEGGCSVDFCNTRTWRFSYRKVKGLPVKGLLLGERRERRIPPKFPPVLERGQRRRQEGTTDKHTHMSDEEEVIVIVD